jgi:para-aminobenzoate synthetase/4-amino-4-deoxychorismate lyase
MAAERSYPAGIPFSATVRRFPLAMDKTPSEVLRAASLDERPFALLGAWADGRALVGSDPVFAVEGAEDPFALLDLQPAVTATEPAAVGGGWVGYLGYGLARLIERLPVPPPRPVPLPTSVLAFYDHLLVREVTGQWWFEALWSDEQSERLEARLSRWQRRAGEAEEPVGSYSCGPFLLRPSPHEHLVSVARAIEHIRSGDVFQVNVCTRLEADFSGDPLGLFSLGLERLVPRYGAFLGASSFAIASFSPELFLKRQDREVLSSPIKGTARRDGPGAAARHQLLGSSKDRAENLMIVDLVRNDLGRVCRYGSVAVPQLWRAEEHPGLWHLVSDVTGELRADVPDSELLRASFPPGSVTGAPKVRAMELVSALEDTAREVYTGAVGMASPLRGLELSVAIRTFELSGGKAWLGVGGGIVADSDPQHELEECLDKSRPLLTALGASLQSSAPGTGSSRDALFGLVPDAREDGVFETMLVLCGRPVALEAHLGRLAASVRCLYGLQPPARLGAEVLAGATGRSDPQRLRVRVRLVAGELDWEVILEPAPEAFVGSPGSPANLVPVVFRGGFGIHKWHDRAPLLARRAQHDLAPHEQLLLIDEDGAVLESEQANVFAVVGGVVRTPPRDGRLLGGTTSAAVVNLARDAGLSVRDDVLWIHELASAEEVFLTSSVRGIRAVGCVRGHGHFETGPVTARLASALWASWSKGTDTAPLAGVL